MLSSSSSRLYGAVLFAASLALGCAVAAAPAQAQLLPFLPFGQPDAAPPPQQQMQASDPADEQQDVSQRQVVAYSTAEPAGTIVIDTPHTYLYLTLGGGRAIRYPIGVGRQGFAWSGVEHITRKAEWPDWIPPAEMVARQPYLPRFIGGGPGNPLGARAMYLGNTDYRIHGTNDPSSIGKHMSSGCIRLLNADVIDLYNRVNIGAKVVVLVDPQRQAGVAGSGRAHSLRPALSAVSRTSFASGAGSGAAPTGVY